MDDGSAHFGLDDCDGRDVEGDEEAGQPVGHWVDLLFVAGHRILVGVEGLPRQGTELRRHHFQVVVPRQILCVGFVLKQQ